MTLERGCWQAPFRTPIAETRRGPPASYHTSVPGFSTRSRSPTHKQDTAHLLGSPLLDLGRRRTAALTRDNAADINGSECCSYGRFGSWSGVHRSQVLAENFSEHPSFCNTDFSAGFAVGRSLYVALTNKSNSTPLPVTRGPGFKMSSPFSPLPDGFEPNSKQIFVAVDAAWKKADTGCAIFYDAADIHGGYGTEQIVLADVPMAQDTNQSSLLVWESPLSSWTCSLTQRGPSKPGVQACPSG
eukprot:425662-Rhodomonas_salina.1